MRISRVQSATVADRVLRGLRKMGEMSLAQAGIVMGCAPARVADTLHQLISSTKDPLQYVVSLGEQWAAGRKPLRTVQIFIEPKQEATLRRRMMRLPEFQQVAKLPPPPTPFTLGQAARALRMPSKNTRGMLDQYRRMGYLTWFKSVPQRGRGTLMWQRRW